MSEEVVFQRLEVDSIEDFGANIRNILLLHQLDHSGREVPCKNRSMGITRAERFRYHATSASIVKDFDVWYVEWRHLINPRDERLRSRSGD